MRSSARPTVILAVAVAVAAIGSPAHAGSLNPNPAPTTPIPAGFTNVTAGTPKFAVTATPNPAVFIAQGNCPWLLPALSAEGFAKADATNPRGYTGANGWTINFVELSNTGSFTRNMYYPYADKAPEFTLNGLKSTATNQAGFGGAVWALTYAAGVGDPSGASAEWLQVVKTNFSFGATDPHKVYGFNAGGGFTYFIDNFYPGNTPANNGTMNPTYDGGYTNPAPGVYEPKGFLANPTTFIDVPSIPLSNGLTAQFQNFLVTDNPGTKTLTIYDGTWWGFQVASVPEPSTWILLVSGCGIVALARRSDLRARRSPPVGARPSLRG